LPEKGEDLSFLDLVEWSVVGVWFLRLLLDWIWEENELVWAFVVSIVGTLLGGLVGFGVFPVPSFLFPFVGALSWTVYVPVGFVAFLVCVGGEVWLGRWLIPSL
jgi:hypothetical protein